MIDSSKNVVHFFNALHKRNATQSLLIKVKKRLNVDGIASEKATTLATWIVMEIVAKTIVDPFANGFEKRNPIVVGAIGVTLGASLCMFGTCITLAVEIKEKTTIETIGVWTYGVTIDEE